ncbi:hypothetical protein DL991_10290 [Amycolatopsis sp. WAC 01375]|nr:hypothetical protein DL991_10290 [Amycolatopsis sp. WAC 01375]
MILTPAPPATPLALTPDSDSSATVDLTGLDAIHWTHLEHAHGSAEDVPGLIRALARNSDDWVEVLDELFGDDLLHQGTCYSATAPAMPFIVGLAAAGALPASRRLDLFLVLLFASDRWADSLLGDADRAAAENRRPGAAPWTQDVHQSIGNELPALLARWDAEPPATQYVLACLAALYPQHGRQVIHQISALAADHAGTQSGAYLQLADALMRDDRDRALTIAYDIVNWAEDLDPGWLDAPGASATLKAGHILAEGAARTAQTTAFDEQKPAPTRPG